MRVSVPGVGTPRDSVRLTFDGTEIQGRLGDTVAAALVAAGILGYREVGDGSFRGLFCGMGACNECAVVINGEPGQLACMVQAKDGMQIEAQPPKIVPPSAPKTTNMVEEVSPPVLVVGGGPAGLSAAATIAEAGGEVTLVDERSKLGGQFYKQPGTNRVIVEDELDSQYRAGRRLEARARKAGVNLVNGVSIWGAFAPDLLTATSADKSWVFRPGKLILATGAQERPVPIPGWTLPGVINTGAAQTLLRSSQVSPGRRVLLSGNGPLNMQVAAELVRASVEVVALVEQADVRWSPNVVPGLRMAAAAPELVRRGTSYRWTLARAGVPLIARSSVVTIDGDGKVETAVVAAINPDGEPIAGTEETFAVDAVCLGYGFLPSNEIARAIGCSHEVDPEGGGLVTIRTDTGRTSVESVWVVGDAGGISGAHVAEAMGTVAGYEVANDLGLIGKTPKAVIHARKSLRRHLRFQQALRNLYRVVPLTTQLAEPDTVVCRCESVKFQEVAESVSHGSGSIGALKRTTRAGMGKCQGRYCSPTLLALTQAISGSPNDEFSGFAPQPPIRPAAIGRIARKAPPE